MDKGIFTAIDANLNRVLEGLRVCEDIFRFNIRNVISEEIKTLRHRITSLSRIIPSVQLLDARDVEADSQKFVDTQGEMKRESVTDLFRANIRRAAEGLRALEEFSKTIDTDISAGFQQARFDVYDIEKRGVLSIGRAVLLSQFNNSLYAIIDSEFVQESEIRNTAEILAASGADIIQLRMKGIPDRIFFEHACAVADVCRKAGSISIINDRADIALLAKADGVHLGQCDLPVSKINEISGRLLTGVSVSCLAEAVEAFEGGADYIAFGPVYSTASKSGKTLDGLGTDILREIVSASETPVVAIGGINSANINDILTTGCSCAALISGLYKNNSLAADASFIKKKLMKTTENI